MHTLPRDKLFLSSVDELLLLPGVKGLPLTEPLRQGAIGAQGWNVLHGDTSFPVAVVKSSVMLSNLAWMRNFCTRHGISLAPHGKTTMSPQLFAAQLANGAWGITLANAKQVQVAYRFNVRRVLLANQLVANTDIDAVLALLRDDPGFECFVLVDSSEGVTRLAQATMRHKLSRPLPVLVELGLPGKRAGCRTLETALAVAHELAAAEGLVLAGFEGYEGLVVTQNHDADVLTVKGFLAQLAELVKSADEHGLFGAAEILISAGGSSYFDLVARGFAGMVGLSRPVRPVLRSGCYLTSDHGSYQRLLAQLDAREAHGEGLRPALEVWSMVQSRPEPDLAILTMGKRDASYDEALPTPLFTHRPGSDAVLPAALPSGCTIFKMNDQHAYLRLPEGEIRDILRVGDLVGCGISHPCTTFDKWQVLLAVDDAYNVTEALNTFF